MPQHCTLCCEGRRRQALATALRSTTGLACVGLTLRCSACASDAMRLASVPVLRQLNLTGQRLDDGALLDVLEALTALSALPCHEIASMTLTETMAGAVLASSPHLQQLRELHLCAEEEQGACGGAAMRALFAGLQMLRLSGLCSPWSDEAAMSIVWQRIGSLAGLTSLLLDSVDMSDLGGTAGAQLCKLSRLQRLCFVGCEVPSGQDAILLAKSLASLTSVVRKRRLQSNVRLQTPFLKTPYANVQTVGVSKST
jgi:hypothetical protein